MFWLMFTFITSAGLGLAKGNKTYLTHNFVFIVICSLTFLSMIKHLSHEIKIANAFRLVSLEMCTECLDFVHEHLKFTFHRWFKRHIVQRQP